MLIELKNKLVPFFVEATGCSAEFALNNLEVPKNHEQGDLSFPTFSLAKQFKKSPVEIAIDVVKKFDTYRKAQCENSVIEKTQAFKGFVNFYFTSTFIQSVLLQGVQKENIGFRSTYKGQRLIIDYSSPNVAKPMGIGHLRSAIIGQSLSHLARSQGFEVIGVDHIGDWGVQFGRLAWAYNHWSDEYDFKAEPFKSLYKLYVRFHKEAEDRPEILKEGSLMFQKLEQGDKELKKLWKYFVEITLKENNKLYKIMRIFHDKSQGESFYNDKMQIVEEILTQKKLLKEDQEAMVVRLDDENMPPCLIRKKDGASLYATRELAAAIYRFETEKAQRVIIETDLGQSLHFKQVKAVLKKMGYSWVDQLYHVSHGLYKFKNQKMSTRQGNIIFLKDVIQRSIDLMKNIIENKHPELENKDEVAKQVGLGALYFNDLMNDRVRDVIIDWDRILDFNGDSGPYVQYSQVRCKSLIKKYGKDVSFKMPVELNQPSEKQLIRILLSYEDVLAASFQHLKPHLLANYLLDVCRSFSHFYHTEKVLGEPEAIEESRINLVYCTQRIIESGLALLNIESPDTM